MNHWDLTTVAAPPRQPQILTTTDDGRAIVLALEAGGELADHQVHERAWITVVAGEIEMVVSATGERILAGAGTLFEFDPGERHEVVAKTDARLLLLLTPWPGSGHPGATPLNEKAHARTRAAERQHGVG